MARRFKSVVQLDSGLLIPASAGVGKQLISDASGNATWQFEPIPWTTKLGPYAAQFGTAGAAGTGMLGFPVAAGLVATGFSLLTTNVPVLRLDPADFAVTGRTVQWRIVASALVNTVAPGTVTWAVGLYPITPAGAAGALTGTIGALIGNAASIVSPGASANVRTVGSTFTTALVAGTYGLAVVQTGAMAANSAVRIEGALEMSYV